VTTPDKPDPVRAWLYVDNLLADEELARLEKLSEKELEDELRAAGIDRVPSTEELMARAAARAARSAAKQPTPAKPPEAAPATVTALPVRQRRSVWAIGLLAAALSITLIVMSTGGVGTPHHESAAELREQAYTACGAHDWRKCETKLDDARTIDPKGENEPRVIAARKAIHDALPAHP
jgi:hypothetical protein